MDAIIRILGLIALLWTNWWVALLCYFALSITNMSHYQGKALIKNTPLRILVEGVTSVFAVYGFWNFPLLNETLRKTVAIAAVGLILWMWLRLAFFLVGKLLAAKKSSVE